MAGLRDGLRHFGGRDSRGGVGVPHGRVRPLHPARPVLAQVARLPADQLGRRRPPVQHGIPTATLRGADRESTRPAPAGHGGAAAAGGRRAEVRVVPTNALRTSRLLARRRDRAPRRPLEGSGRDQRRGEWRTFRLPIRCSTGRPTSTESGQSAALRCGTADASSSRTRHVAPRPRRRIAVRTAAPSPHIRRREVTPTFPGTTRGAGASSRRSPEPGSASAIRPRHHGLQARAG